MTEMLSIGSVGKESACSAGDAGRCEFDSQVWKMPWRGACQSTNRILAWRIPWTQNLEGYSPWGRTESDMTDET